MSYLSTTVRVGLLVCWCAAWALPNARAVDIPIGNAGFELPVLGDGGEYLINGVDEPSWFQETTRGMYVLNPLTSDFSSGEPVEGANALWGDGRYGSGFVKATASQMGLAVIDESLTYTLTLKVGHSISWDFGDYTISLLKDDEVAAAISNFGEGELGPTPTTKNTWSDVTLSYTPVAGDAGKNLGIRLQTGEILETTFLYVTWFDDLHLTAVAAALDGDLNDDGFVGQDDLNIILGAWGQNVTQGDRMAGDPSNDGFVGQDDLNFVLGDWGQGTPAVVGALSTVPEPQSLLLGIVGLAGLVVFWRRQGR